MVSAILDSDYPTRALMRRCESREIRGLSLPAIHKHIKLLGNAGIVKRRKTGRTNFLTLNRSAIRTLQDWLGQYHAYWGTEEETLENYERFLSEKQANLTTKGIKK